MGIDSFGLICDKIDVSAVNLYNKCDIYLNYNFIFVFLYK